MPDLPSTPAALWRAMRLAYRAEPKLLVISFVLVAGALIPEALNALWLKLLADGVSDGRTQLVAWASTGLAGSAAAAWLMKVVGDRVHFLFRERATIAIESHVAHLQASVATIEHHERPEYLDRLQMLKDNAFLLNHLYHAFMTMAGLAARVVITVGLLMSVHPTLVVLAVFALPTILSATWRAKVERRVQESAAPHQRLARHLFTLGTTAGPGKELRVTGNAAGVVAQRRASWDHWFAMTSAHQRGSAASHAAAWTVFGVAYVASAGWVASRGSAGDVVLALSAGANLARYLGMTAGNAGFLSWCIDATKRLVWLERFAAAHGERADAPVPSRIESGIRLEHVSFAYPGTEKLVLQDVDLELPSGSVVAIVGENGAGKTTLVKCQ